MCHVYVWKWQPFLLETFSTYEVAKEVMDAISEINPGQKVWIEPVVCKDSVQLSLDYYKSLRL